MFWSCGHSSRQFLKISQYWHYTLLLFARLQRKPLSFCIFGDGKCCLSAVTCPLSSHMPESEASSTPLNSTQSVSSSQSFQMMVLWKQSKWRQVVVWWSATPKLKWTHICATASGQWTQEVYWTVPKRQQLYYQFARIWDPQCCFSFWLLGYYRLTDKALVNTFCCSLWVK